MAIAPLKVFASLQDQSVQPEQGVLTFFDNAVDKATGNIKLKATFENASKNLWPGQFVNVSLDLTERSDAVVVPSQAVLTGQNGQYVYVVKPDMSVEPRPVVTSITYQDFTVVDKGLSAGESVVIDGQLQLVPGAKVEVKPQPGSAANEAAKQDSR
jgi:multidrug efflux system membrane fusion protein